jgi:hypothetical protein
VRHFAAIEIVHPFRAGHHQERCSTIGRSKGICHGTASILYLRLANWSEPGALGKGNLIATKQALQKRVSVSVLHSAKHHTNYRT